MEQIQLYEFDFALKLCRQHFFARGVTGSYCASPTTFFEIEHVYPLLISEYLRTNPDNHLRLKENYDEDGYIIMVQYQLMELSKSELIISKHHQALYDFNSSIDGPLEKLTQNHVEEFVKSKEVYDFEKRIMTTPMPYEMNFWMAIEAYSNITEEKLIYKDKNIEGYAIPQKLGIETREGLLYVYLKVEHTATEIKEDITFASIAEMFEESSWCTKYQFTLEEFYERFKFVKIAEAYKLLYD